MIYFKQATGTAIVPKRGSKGAAGFDLFADLGMGNDLTLFPGVRQLVPTNIQVALPANTYMRIAPRSGLAFKNGIDIMAGVIDEDYRGEIGVIMINHSDTKFVVRHGDRIAQGIVTMVYPDLEAVTVLQNGEELPNTDRGAGGFGSTGR